MLSPYSVLLVARLGCLYTLNDQRVSGGVAEAKEVVRVRSVYVSLAIPAPPPSCLYTLNDQRLSGGTAETKEMVRVHSVPAPPAKAKGPYELKTSSTPRPRLTCCTPDSPSSDGSFCIGGSSNSLHKIQGRNHTDDFFAL